MTTLQNCMEAPVQMLGLSKAGAEARSAELLDGIGFAGKKDQHPSGLSGATGHNLTKSMGTHRMGFAKETSDRDCFFFAGKIAEQGPPEQIFGDPRNERTRQCLSAVHESG